METTFSFDFTGIDDMLLKDGLKFKEEKRLTIERMRFTRRKRDVEAKLRVYENDFNERFKILFEEQYHLLRYLKSELSIWLLSYLELPFSEIKNDFLFFQHYDSHTMTMMIRVFIQRLVSKTPNMIQEEQYQIFLTNNHFAFPDIEVFVNSEEDKTKFYSQVLPQGIVNCMCDLIERLDYLEWVKSYLNVYYKIFESPKTISEPVENPKAISEPIEKVEITNLKLDIKWVGKNKTAFIQLIYALYHAGLITNESDQITDLVPEVAKALNLDLGKNWQSLLSKSKNKRNYDYIPEIFENLENAYQEFSKPEIFEILKESYQNYRQNNLKK